MDEGRGVVKRPGEEGREEVSVFRFEIVPRPDTRQLKPET
jgi:hypothetical protein